MKISEMAAIVEAESAYPLVSIRRDNHYFLVDIGFVNDMGHASPIVPFVMHDSQLEDAFHGPDLVRILTREAGEKLRRFLPQVSVHQ
jgi:hypothetical protein